MGRKAKCSTEEKVKAVEDYLNGIRSMSEIMNDLSRVLVRLGTGFLSISSKELLHYCQAARTNLIPKSLRLWW